MQIKGIPGDYGLEQHGLRNLRTIYWNLFPPELVEQVVLRGEGDLAKLGSVVVCTGQHTGRSPNDKFIVQDPASKPEEIWWGKVNQPLSCEKYDSIYAKMLAYLQGRDVFVQDLAAGAHPSYQVPIRVITEKAWAALFANNLAKPEGLSNIVLMGSGEPLDNYEEVLGFLRLISSTDSLNIGAQPCERAGG